MMRAFNEIEWREADKYVRNEGNRINRSRHKGRERNGGERRQRRKERKKEQGRKGGKSSE